MLLKFFQPDSERKAASEQTQVRQRLSHFSALSLTSLSYVMLQRILLSAHCLRLQSRFQATVNHLRAPYL